MAIVHVNGFGTLPVAGDYVTLLNAGTATSTFSRQVGRSGGYALRHSHSNSGVNTVYQGRLALPVLAEFSVGVAINHRATYTPASNTFSLQLLFTTVDFEVMFGTNVANTYSTASGTSAWTIVDATATTVGWHWWNLIFKRHATEGVYQVWRDGVMLAHKGTDTDPTPALSGVFLWLGNATGTGAQADFGDLIIRNDASAIPDTVVTSLFPDGTSAGAWVGSDGNSTDNHLLVNENPTYSAATYVGSPTVGATDTYTVGNLPNSAASVSAVQVGARAFKSDAGAKTLATTINGVAGTAADPGGGATIYQIATTNPSGGAAWGTASVNAMTAGIKVVS